MTPWFIAHSWLINVAELNCIQPLRLMGGRGFMWSSVYRQEPVGGHHLDQVPGVDGAPALPGVPAAETWQPPWVSPCSHSHLTLSTLPCKLD